MTGRGGVVAAAVAVALLLLPMAAAAQQDSAVTPRVEILVGAQLFSDFNSSVRLDSEARGVGTEIDLEDDVDLEERISVARTEAIYNFNARHHIWLAAYDIDRTGSRRIVGDIRFRDETFTLDTTVGTSFEETIAKVSYGFNALVRPRGVVGPTAGLHVMDLSLRLSVAGQPLTEDASTTAPLPVLGVRGQYRFADRWHLRGSLEWFDVEVGDVDGLFTDFLVAVEHDTFEHAGFGFGFNDLGLDIESSDDSFRGTVDLSFSSFVAYVRGSFGTASRQRIGD